MYQKWSLHVHLCCPHFSSSSSSCSSSSSFHLLHILLPHLLLLLSLVLILVVVLFCLLFPLKLLLHRYHLLSSFFFFSSFTCILFFFLSSLLSSHIITSSIYSSITHRCRQQFLSKPYVKDVRGGRNSSLVVFGLTVHSVAGSILLWGNFPVKGIFPLELTWVQTQFPPKLFRMRV